ncbi:hypothetical protein NL108_013635 [Boleophthalmus pectinirostris]|nr:hypothetical protein NL108_013635 [Boleophthalmus pectinirostris]
MSSKRKLYFADYKLQIVKSSDENGNRAAERKFGVTEKLVTLGGCTMKLSWKSLDVWTKPGKRFLEGFSNCCFLAIRTKFVAIADENPRPVRRKRKSVFEVAERRREGEKGQRQTEVILGDFLPATARLKQTKGLKT